MYSPCIFSGSSGHVPPLIEDGCGVKLPREIRGNELNVTSRACSFLHKVPLSTTTFSLHRTANTDYNATSDDNRSTLKITIDTSNFSNPTWYPFSLSSKRNNLFTSKMHDSFTVSRVSKTNESNQKQNYKQNNFCYTCRVWRMRITENQRSQVFEHSRTEWAFSIATYYVLLHLPTFGLSERNFAINLFRNFAGKKEHSSKCRLSDALAA